MGLDEQGQAVGGQGVVAPVVVQHGRIEGLLVVGGSGGGGLLRGLGPGGGAPRGRGGVAQAVVEHPRAVLELAHGFLEIGLETPVLGPGHLRGLAILGGLLVGIFHLAAQLEDLHLEVGDLVLDALEAFLG